jgi:Recombination endonuclease VII
MSQSIYQPRKSAQTFEGNLCKKCGNNLRYTSDNRCVNCRKRWRQSPNVITIGNLYKKSEKGRMKRRINDLRTRYNITLDEVKEMLIRQNGQCAVCPTPLTELNGQVDHNHKTSVVRGILCNYCNWAAGLLKDDPIYCRNLANYLENPTNHSA